MTCLQNKLKKILEKNFNVNHWYELIDLTSPDIMEPTMQHYSIEEIQYFPSHYLSVERTIKLVLEAFHYVYGLENQHSCI